MGCTSDANSVGQGVVMSEPRQAARCSPC
jgi:hypothetical protein